MPQLKGYYSYTKVNFACMLALKCETQRQIRKHDISEKENKITTTKQTQQHFVTVSLCSDFPFCLLHFVKINYCFSKYINITVTWVYFIELLHTVTQWHEYSNYCKLVAVCRSNRISFFFFLRCCALRACSETCCKASQQFL